MVRSNTFDSLQITITETLGFEDTTLAPHSVAELHEEMELLNACVDTNTQIISHLNEMETNYSVEGVVSLAQLQYCTETCIAHIQALEDLLRSKWLWNNDGLKEIVD